MAIKYMMAVVLNKYHIPRNCLLINLSLFLEYRICFICIRIMRNGMKLTNIKYRILLRFKIRMMLRFENYNAKIYKYIRMLEFERI